jgi:hypothetical protein
VTIDSPSTQKDLIVLVADKNMEAALVSVLRRPESLGIRPLTFDIFVHPYHDSGCLLNAHTFLQPFSQRYSFSLVLFDKEGCGQENIPSTKLEQNVQELLTERGWYNRSCVTVIDPELETWIWKDSPHVSNAIGWANRLQELYTWLEDKGFIENNESRPSRPKEALEAALRSVKKPRSSSIYSELGSKISLRKCTDPSFVRMRTQLQIWFLRQT